MAYKTKKPKAREINVYSFGKNPDKAKEGDKIYMFSKEDGAVVKDEFKISEKYKVGNNIFFEDYRNEGILIYNKKTKKWS